MGGARTRNARETTNRQTAGTTAGDKPFSETAIRDVSQQLIAELGEDLADAIMKFSAFSGAATRWMQFWQTSRKMNQREDVAVRFL